MGLLGPWVKIGPFKPTIWATWRVKMKQEWKQYASWWNPGKALWLLNHSDSLLETQTPASWWKQTFLPIFQWTSTLPISKHMVILLRLLSFANMFSQRARPWPASTRIDDGRWSVWWRCPATTFPQDMTGLDFLFLGQWIFGFPGTLHWQFLQKPSGTRWYKGTNRHSSASAGPM